MIFEFFKEKSGAPLFGVPYKGSGTAMTEVMGGQVQLIVDTATALRGHVQSGKLKAIAITTLKSGELLPGVKSVAEQGVAGFEMTPWTALYAPRGTPKEIVDKLNAEVARIVALPDVQARFRRDGFIAQPMSPDRKSVV